MARPYLLNDKEVMVAGCGTMAPTQIGHHKGIPYLYSVREQGDLPIVVVPGIVLSDIYIQNNHKYVDVKPIEDPRFKSELEEILGVIGRVSFPGFN